MTIRYEVNVDEVRVFVEVWDDYGRETYTRISHFLDGLAKETATAYVESLIQHITLVREAGEKLGVEPELLIVHDRSKFDHEEFPHYANRFHVGIGESPLDAANKAGNVSDNFARAWLHHIHHNPHHWQHWMFADGFTPKGSSVENGIVQMPGNYALEMIADWMGASMVYTGDWDMREWLLKNVGRIRLHSRTAAYVGEVLAWLGYEDVVRERPFGSEVG